MLTSLRLISHSLYLYPEKLHFYIHIFYILFLTFRLLGHIDKNHSVYTPTNSIFPHNHIIP